MVSRLNVSEGPPGLEKVNDKIDACAGVDMTSAADAAKAHLDKNFMVAPKG